MCRGCEGFFFASQVKARKPPPVLTTPYSAATGGCFAAAVSRPNYSETRPKGGQARTPPPRHACARTRSTICQSTPPEFPTQPREVFRRPPDRIERPRGGGPRAAPCTPTRRGGWWRQATSHRSGMFPPARAPRPVGRRRPPSQSGKRWSPGWIRAGMRELARGLINNVLTTAAEVGDSIESSFLTIKTVDLGRRTRHEHDVELGLESWRSIHPPIHEWASENPWTRIIH
jgi:hypothetical protein